MPGWGGGSKGPRSQTHDLDLGSHWKCQEVQLGHAGSARGALTTHPERQVREAGGSPGASRWDWRAGRSCAVSSCPPPSAGNIRIPPPSVYSTSINI